MLHEASPITGGFLTSVKSNIGVNLVDGQRGGEASGMDLE